VKPLQSVAGPEGPFPLSGGGERSVRQHPKRKILGADRPHWPGEISRRYGRQRGRGLAVGGRGYDASSTIPKYLNDLWRYTPSTAPFRLFGGYGYDSTGV